MVPTVCFYIDTIYRYKRRRGDNRLLITVSNVLALLTLSSTFVLQVLYALCVLGVSLYGMHAFWLVWQLCRRTTPTLDAPPLPTDDAAALPRVTVQLPLYNEMHVVERLIDACARLDYPRHLLQIQVLDDSDDGTTELAERRALLWRSRGVWIEVVRRAERSGYKAGALAYALPFATGDFIAIFDADFVPPAHFLRALLPRFFAPGGESVAFVQGRWAHLNASFSPLTGAQALAIDGHFVVEQGGRQAAGYCFGFNGSAGIWRRACLDDAQVGGWQADTLCEDLDLSYRAQLAGWQPLYCNKVEAPAEIPPQLIAFKRQQFRWAKGSVQTLRKLGARVWQSEWPLDVRLMALYHLGAYLMHPLLLGLLLFTLPLVLLDASPAWPLTYFSLASLGPPLLYAIAQRRLHGRAWHTRYRALPLLTLLGLGLSVNNTLAVIEALRGRRSDDGGVFLRTPKFRVTSSDAERAASSAWQASHYRLPLDRAFWGESVLLVCTLAAVVATVARGNWWSLPLLLLYAFSFASVAAIGLWQALPERATPMRTPTESPTSESERFGRDLVKSTAEK